jgi:histidine triad (HIT) family protein
VNCVFCRIIAGEIPGDRVAEDDLIIAIKDNNPQAPVHVLLMPREHLSSAAELTEMHGGLLSRLFSAANRIAGEQGIGGSGYRIITNCGPDAGQAVQHLHFHLLGGRNLGSLVIS